MPGEPAKRKDTDGQSTAKGSLPQISLPKGGGAISDIDEKFSVNAATGTASLSIPISTTPARSDFYPKLSLTYDSGAGNGPFGMGWDLSLPSITRKTAKGLPQYADDVDSDVYILSGAEDLVPVLVSKAGDWTKEILDPADGSDFLIQRYRPRIEGLFARIERRRHKRKGEVHWRSITKDNITNVYGRSPDARISDPDDPSRVFSWMLEESRDARGNVIVYKYKRENMENLTPSSPWEEHRTSANLYLKSIQYGNTIPNDAATAVFTVVFDYGEHNLSRPSPSEDGQWTNRPDPFSSYRSTFEVRTHRLCRRILMFHSFEELGATPCLVRSTDFNYALSPIATLLNSVQSTGYIRDPETGTYISATPAGEMASPKSMPPLEFGYRQVAVDDTVRTIDPESLENLPAGLDGARYEWIDLESEGLPGVLTEQADAWFYKHNLSNVPDDGGEPSGAALPVRFGPAQMVAARPSVADLTHASQRLIDLAGDGRMCLVSFGESLPGFYEMDECGSWGPFTPFQTTPNIDWNDPELKFIDLNGDGFSDLLITEDAVFTWYASLAKEGFTRGERVSRPTDEETGPALLFSDASQSVYLADMTGDGLTDLVRIRSGEVCYWPNLGYGRFGAKVTMGDGPVFDSPDQFDHKRIRLGDVDGSGVTDILYIGREQIVFWLNQSGNSWSAPHQITSFPAVDDLSSVMILDLLGHGTACLVWSSPLPDNSRMAMAYVDLMGGRKPYLLESVVNNLGAETRIDYAASTKFYLQDRNAGRPWITKLPFPVHVVERVETFEGVTKSKLVTLYRYHHGYYDGVEREFRGFGCVEQRDTESFSRYSGTGLFTTTPDTAGEEFHLPPVRTITWFHTGAYLDRENISHHFADEYFAGDSLATLLPDAVLPEGLTVEEEREACRSLKGRTLRQEVYADDNLPESKIPYTVSEHAFRMVPLQAKGPNLHAVFYAYESETLAYNYERYENPSRDASGRLDPRVGHQLVLEVDGFGNVVRSAAVAYPRRTPTGSQPAHRAEQTQTAITYTENLVTNKTDQPDWYRIGMPVETRSYELTGVKHGIGALYAVEELADAGSAAASIPYEDPGDGASVQKRLIERARTLYRKNDLSGALPDGGVESLALPWESYRMAFTPGLVTRIYSGKTTEPLDTVFSEEGRYVDLDGDGSWWIPSGRLSFSPDPEAPDPVYATTHFFQPAGFRDPFGQISRVTRDDYGLAIIRTEDALGNTVSAETDYRVLQPRLVTDPNDNRSAVRFDALGMVIRTAVMGKEGAGEGDTIEDPTTRLEYDLLGWMRSGSPATIHAFVREQHGRPDTRWQESYSYSDGLGREVMRKIQAEPGSAPLRDSTGALERDAGGKLEFGYTASRWVGSGRKVFDNKGNAVKQYEPFFDSSAAYVQENDLVQWGVTPIMRYDPPGRPIRIDYPDGSLARNEFNPWQQINWDQNDTLLESRWHAERVTLPPDDPNWKADHLTLEHAATPAVVHVDPLGRAFAAIADNGKDGKYETATELDIEGNQRSVTDELGRLVMTYDYDVTGRRMHQISIDAGERWSLPDIAERPIRVWDSRGHEIRYTYDELRRPVNLYIRSSGGTEVLAEKIVYGEAIGGSKSVNLRGRVFQLCDGAGVLSNDIFDFKGNLKQSTRQLLTNYRDPVDWSGSPGLDGESFTVRTAFDALNRPTALTSPRGDVTLPGYNEANLLESLNVSMRGSAATAYITNLDYNARGQREVIEYGNGAKTEYEYDPFTFRLKRSITTRSSDTATLQDFEYTYDPIGNIVAIQDRAQPTVYFKNLVVDADGEYHYDAIYRLILATGREHLGQNADKSLSAPQQPGYDDSFRINLPHPSEGNAMGRYTETYAYDPVGNILKMIHGTATGSWVRQYDYTPLPGEVNNNRLRGTNRPGEIVEGSFSDRYTYDVHGNMTSMPHLPAMGWDFKDQLQTVDLLGGGKAYYVYDSGGQRVRKVWEKSAGLMEERIYLGSFEIFRRHVGSDLSLERDTLHVSDGQRRVALVETKTIDDGAIAPPEPLARYQHDNHLGSACLELDEAAGIISYEEYFPYGSTSYQAVQSLIEVSVKRYRYTGKERDEESGFYYHGARYYAPWLGRWTSSDPAGLSDGLNLYRYARNAPTVLMDPNGTEAPDPRQFSSFEEFLQNSPGPYSVEYLEQVWTEAGLPLACGVYSPAEVSSLVDNLENTAIGGKLRQPDAVKVDIDEPNAVSNGGAWDDPSNKQFMESNTNRITKNAGIEASTTPPRSQISLAEAERQGPEAFRRAASEMLTARRFSEVGELEQIVREARADMTNLNRSPRELANAINRAIRGRIASGASPEARLVNRALVEMGVDPKTIGIKPSSPTMPPETTGPESSETTTEPELEPTKANSAGSPSDEAVGNEGRGPSGTGELEVLGAVGIGLAMADIATSETEDEAKQKSAFFVLESVPWLIGRPVGLFVMALMTPGNTTSKEWQWKP